MPFTTIAIVILVAATMFSSYIVGKENGQNCTHKCKRKPSVQPKPYKKAKRTRIEDNRAVTAKTMHRGTLIKWCIKTWPKKPKTPFRNMRKSDLIKLYTNWTA
jgi:hypothetical protein